MLRAGISFVFLKTGSRGAQPLLFARPLFKDSARNAPRHSSDLGSGAVTTLQFRLGEDCGDHHPKTDIVVPVIRIVVVAGGAAQVPFIIVEGAPTQHTRVFWIYPCKSGFRRVLP